LNNLVGQQQVPGLVVPLLALEPASLVPFEYHNSRRKQLQEHLKTHNLGKRFHHQAGASEWTALMGSSLANRVHNFHKMPSLSHFDGYNLNK
jgi:hypothetical protein